MTENRPKTDVDPPSRVAMVTGGGSGIGKAVCEKLALNRLTVAVSDINLSAASQVAQEIRHSGGIAHAYQIDVSKTDNIQQAVSNIQKQLGTITVLVNNAGIGDAFPDGQLKKFHRIYAQRFHEWKTRQESLDLTPVISESRWQRMLDVNLSSVFYCCRAVLPGMQQNKWGRIINVSSVAAIIGSLGSPHYAASKAGILGLTRALALETAPAGITVNAICPGLIDTAMAPLLPPEAIQWFLDRVPMHRWGQPEEVASVIRFFASEESSYITGQTLSVDGGGVV